MVRMVVPDARNRVGSAGLSEMIFMYCAADGPAAHIESAAPKTSERNASFMTPPCPHAWGSAPAVGHTQRHLGERRLARPVRRAIEHSTATRLLIRKAGRLGRFRGGDA